MKIHLPLHLAYLGLIACACSPAPATVTDMPLVRDSRSPFHIVHAADAPRSVRTAAQELQRYVERSTSAKLPITAGDAPARSPFIVLGDTPAARAAGISTADLPLEGFRLLSRDGNLFIVGFDTRDGETTPEGGTSTGRLNGVYTFLEDYLNVRWLLPGPLGEDVPSQATVIVPAMDRTEQPLFRNRRLPGVQNTQPSVLE